MNGSKRISDEMLGQVSGGALFNAVNIEGSDRDNPWEVLDERGNVLERRRTRDEALYQAGVHRVDPREVSWEDVQRMRK